MPGSIHRSAKRRPPSRWIGIPLNRPLVALRDLVGLSQNEAGRILGLPINQGSTLASREGRPSVQLRAVVRHAEAYGLEVRIQVRAKREAR